MTKQERLNNLILRLSRSECTVKDLASAYGTTERTIQNDIKELSTVYKIISPARGVYKLIFDFEIEEKFEEVFSSFIIKANYDIFHQFEDLVKKIEMKTQFKPTELFEINFKLEELNDSSILIDLMQDIDWKYSVEFEYKGKKRIIQPLKILNYNAVWYLIGFDLKHNKMKTFKINKIEKLISKTENLMGEDIKKLQKKVKNIHSPWIEKQNKSVIRVYYPLSENVTENIIKKEKNFVEVEIEYYDEREAFDLIKKYLPYVKIMDEELKEKIKKILNDGMEFLYNL